MIDAAALMQLPQALTPRQKRVLTFLRRFITEKGYPPTRAEISDVLGFRSPNAAEEHLRMLERKGHIEIDAGVSRGIRLKKSSGDV